MYEQIDIRNTDIVYEAYCKENITVIDHPHISSNTCYIFFSGNGLYYPNTETEFKQKILYENRYEWTNLCKNKLFKKTARKIIFVRDVYKQWYVAGCSKRLNSVDKMVIELKSLTNNYNIITIGNSAGGYAAVLFGILLQARCIYSFSGQFSITDKINDENMLVKNNKSKKYYNLKRLIMNSNRNIPIFWFYAAKSQYDIEQKEIADQLNICQIAFNESIHGKSCFPTDYIPFILKTKDDPAGGYILSLKVYSTISFSYCLFGIKGITRATAYVVKKYINKLMKRKML